MSVHHKNHGLMIGVAIAAVVIGCIFWGLTKYFSKDREQDKGISSNSTIAVSTIMPTEMPLDDILSVSGIVLPWQEISISTEVGGIKLKRILVDIGDSVRKGQLLAQLDDEELRAELAQQKAALVEAKANLYEAESRIKNARPLRGTGAMSEQDYLQYETKAKLAQAQFNSMQAKLDIQKLRLEHATIRAPDDGIISYRGAVPGSSVSNNTEIFRMIRQGRLEWHAELTVNQLAGVHIGQLAVIVTVSGQKVSGTVRQLSPVLDPKTHSGIAYIDLQNSHDVIKAGMYAKGYISLGKKVALVVPEQSIGIRDGREYVFSVDNAHYVHSIWVTTGNRQGGFVEVVSGLKKQQAVVANGVELLSDGDQVRIVPMPADRVKTKETSDIEMYLDEPMAGKSAALNNSLPLIIDDSITVKSRARK